jgi:Tol biopolymer transport system component
VAEDTLIGQQLGQFSIEYPIQHLDGATFYRGFHSETGEAVVVTVYPPELIPDEIAAQRYVDQVEVLVGLDHPYLEPVLGGGQFEGQPYLVGPLATGLTLAEQIENDGPLTPEALVPVLERVADALDALHAQGITHGNVSPDTIFEAGTAHVRLGGLLPEELRAAIAARAGLPGGGDPAYTAPEITRGTRKTTPAADIYALGATAFEALTGRPPYGGDDPIEQLMSHLSDPVPSLVEILPDLPWAVDVVIRRALAKRPDDRYAQAGDFARSYVTAAELAPGPDTTPVFLEGMENPAAPGGGEPPELPPHTPQGFGPTPGSEGPRGGRSGGRLSRRRGASWPVVVITMLLFFVAWFTVGALIGQQARDQVEMRRAAALRATRTQQAATGMADATATQAEVHAGATATRQIVETATAMAAASVDTTPTPAPTATLSPTPTPTSTPFAGSGGLIAYVTDRDGDPEIFVYDLATGEEKRVTDNIAIDGAPAFSPDGRLLAYHSNATTGGRHIFLVSVECVDAPEGCESTRRELTSGPRVDSWPTWSPEGDRIVFTSRENERWWFRSVTLAGEETQLSQIVGDMRLVDWSPDGILTFFGPNFDGGFELQRLPYDGISTEREPITGSGGSIESLDYSPDRSTIIYSQLTGVSRQLFISDASCKLIDQCVIRRITDDRWNYRMPRFSPDGTRILASANLEGDYSLYILDLQGNVLDKLVELPEDEPFSEWQPAP